MWLMKAYKNTAAEQSCGKVGDPSDEGSTSLN